MPAPMSAGVFGMQRTSLRCPPSQREIASSVMPAAMVRTSWLPTEMRSERGLRVLRLDREHEHVGCAAPPRRARSRRAPDSARRGARAPPESTSTTAIERASPPFAISPPISAVAMLPPPRKAIFTPRPSALSRSPKMAVPTRTIVAPSATRELEVVGHAHRQRVEAECLSARLELLHFADSARAPRPGSGIAISPRSRSRGSADDGLRERGDFAAGATPLLVASPLTLTWISTLSGARPAGRCSESRRAIFSLADSVDPVEALGGDARLVALERPDEVPLERRGGRRLAFFARLPARSSRRTPFVRRRPPPRCARRGWPLDTANKVTPGARADARPARLAGCPRLLS